MIRLTTTPAAVPQRKPAYFWIAAAVSVHTLWTSAAPAMFYPIYARQFDLSASTVAGIFAVYPVVVVVALLLLADLPEWVGRKRTMLIGLACSIIGVALFAVADGPMQLFAGRIFMGAGVGLSAGPASAALVEYSPVSRRHIASAANTAAQAVGLALATLIGGALIQYAPLPLRMNYVTLLGFLILLFGYTLWLPSDVPATKPSGWRIRVVGVPKPSRRVFWSSALACVSAFMLGSVFLSAGAQIAHDLVRSSNALVNGSMISLFAAVWGLASIALRRMPFRHTVLVGGICAVVSTILLVRAGMDHSLSLFLLSTVIGGASYGLLFLGGLGNLNSGTPDTSRGLALSSLYFCCYLIQALTALALGLAITRFGIYHALQQVCTLIALLSAVSVGAFWWPAMLDRAPANQSNQNAVKH
ncbi:MFS transporter [Paraburkholderia sp. BCC1884]|uniref:MFS transporter n=1 Tax=Paraburkholderia sp. BCC1884 TaxID=2562668 RepID=UPI001183F4E2|nr:MFS transporter [Paraburkholderia sp. BCC1884]